MDSTINLIRPSAIICVCSCVLITGCLSNSTGEISSLGPQQQKLVQNAADSNPSQATPAMRLSDHRAWIMRLLATPAFETGIQQVSATQGQMIPIPVPPLFAAQGNAYYLKVNQQLQLAWLVNQAAGGESSGPWKLDNPDVVHILNSLRNPPTGAAVQPGPATAKQ